MLQRIWVLDSVQNFVFGPVSKFWVRILLQILSFDFATKFWIFLIASFRSRRSPTPSQRSIVSRVNAGSIWKLKFLLESMNDLSVRTG